MQNFELPTNIKQIGSIDDNGLRIYVEDYVFTYIQQYSLAGGNNERLAMLIGRYLTIDSQPVLFISGAIAGKYCIEENNSLVFSEKSHEYIYDMMDKHFPSLEIVGWVQSQPGYGTYLGSKYYNYHLQNFKNDFQVLFVTDPVQKLNAFYVYDEDDELAETKGYFVYYDKNKPMHEYMMESKATDMKPQERSERSGQPYNDEDDDLDDIPKIAAPKPVRIRTTSSSSSEMDIKRRQMVRKRRTVTEQKRTVTMMTGLCAVMFLVCFVMGAGLIRSEDRITVLERNLATLNTAYRNIAASFEQTQYAFASGEDSVNSPGIVVLENGNSLLDEENATAAQAAAKAGESVETANPTDTPAPSDTASNAEPATATQQTASAAIPESYTVQQGDNLLLISKKFYGTSDMVDKIMEANNLADPNTIYFGKVLILPKQ